MISAYHTYLRVCFLREKVIVRMKSVQIRAIRGDIFFNTLQPFGISAS